MGDNAIGPLSPHRTTQPRAGEAPTTVGKTPGLLLAGLAVISFVVCLTSFAIRQIDIGVSAASVTLLAVGAVLSWLTRESRRVRDVQRR